MTDRDVQNYELVRFSEFDPNGSPETGTHTGLATTTSLLYDDQAWAGLARDGMLMA